MCEMLQGAQRSWAHFVCVCFCMCGRQKPEYPNWSSMADGTITQGGIGGLGSPVLICEDIPFVVHTPSVS